MTRRPLVALVAALTAAFGFSFHIAEGGDWPTWRHDAGRTASTPDPLPQNLVLAWSRQLDTPRPAWPASQTKLRFDECFEPVVAGQRLFLGSNVNDSIAAYDTRTGDLLWQTYTDGPVRFAPVVSGGRVYAISDDGFLYCLDETDGHVVWKVNGGPDIRPILGNDRLVSTWSARGGPVLADGVVYFAASIWPTMGIFIHAVDADTGALLWTNSKTGSEFVIHPHGAPSFGSVVPQGYLAVSGEHLVVPGGRSLPAVLNTKTGAVEHFDFGGKTSGGFDALAGSEYYFVRGEMLRLSDGLRVDLLNVDVLDGSTVIGTPPGSSRVTVVSTEGKVIESETVDRRGNKVKQYKFEPASRTEFATTVTVGKIYLKAGNRIFTAKDRRLAAYELETSGDAQAAKSPVWTAEIDGTVGSLIAADDRLFVSTTEGKLLCFAAEGETAQPRAHERTITALDSPADQWTQAAETILAHDGVAEGYALALGIGSGRLIEELLKQSKLHVIAVDQDAERVAAFRRKMDAAGLYGTRTSAHVGDPHTFPFPPYLANTIVAEEFDASSDSLNARAQHVFAALRPYGGTAFLPIEETAEPAFREAVAEANLAKAELSRSGRFLMLTRAGSLPGSANWTHQYADASNSVVSQDRLVRAPLGVLWYGGPPNDDVLPRHGHGPSPQVAGGRLFIEGPDMLRAVDVYTGRLLWQREIKDVGEYYNITSHFPGANEVGSNYVSLPDAVYVVYGKSILVLDSATGELKNEFQLDPNTDGETPTWGYACAEGDYLIATSTPVTVDTANATRPTKVPEGFVPLVKPNDDWQYLAGGDPPADWTAPEFDASAWKVGAAGFGYGNNGDRTILRDMRGRYGRVYLRKTFDASDVEKMVQMALLMRYDDGFIAYLNGTEIARSNVGKDRGKDAKEIGSREPEAHELFVIEEARKLIRPGTNVLAIEGHNATATGSDFCLDPYVVVSDKSDLALDTSKRASRKSVEAALTRAQQAAASRHLVVLDRKTGKVVWTRNAVYSFRHNCIAAAAGKLFLIDGMTTQQLEALKRRGIAPPEKARLMALDLKTGKELWSTDEDVFGTFLNYSIEHDVLLQGGSQYRDRAKDEVGQGLVAYRGSDGTVLWKDLELKYSGPCLLWRDKIITNGTEGFQLELLTGKQTGWSFNRMYGCNTIIGSQNLLTFRSGAAGFCDLAGDSGTGNLGGFRSSCTSNLIAADGVLNAPDYTRTCMCAYQNQCSLALVYTPEAEFWTFNNRKIDAVVQRGLGINLGAPGDRRAEDGTFWMEYPNVGGPSPEINVAVQPENIRWFVRHSSEISGAGLPWVMASGGEGLTSVSVKLPGEHKAPRLYTVRLHFADPKDDIRPGQRVFSVSLQGAVVLESFDIAGEAGGADQGVVKEFDNVELGDELRIGLEPAAGSSLPPVLCGIEVVPAD